MGKEVIRVVAAVISDEGRYLIAQRQARAVLPLLWEFPGGRVEDGESDTEALEREVRWRIGVGLVVGDKLGDHIHEYDAYDVHLAMYSCSIPAGEHAKAVNVNDVRWVPSAELENYEFPPADERTMNKLLGRIGRA